VGGAYRQAFLFSGVSNGVAQQDQFLNYWFTDMKVEYQWGNFLEFRYGGSITCRGGSYIVTGERPGGGESVFFSFPTAQHAGSVMRFHAEDIRFEVRSPQTVVIDSHWSGGTIRFNDCDDTANAFKSFSATVQPHRYDIGPKGPLVRYDSCQLVGGHQYRSPSGAPAGTVSRYDMCHFVSKPLTALAQPAGVTYTDCLGQAD
jgi:hypothetical protein